MKSKVKKKVIEQAFKEAWIRFPDDNQLHYDMRKTFISRMYKLEQYKQEKREKMIFQLSQVVIIILILLAMYFL